MISSTSDTAIFSNSHCDPITRMEKSSRRAKVLVVDDCKVNAKIASTILTNLGFEVHIACNGKQAVMACLSSEFSFVLMDYQMPEMDGAEATAAIRSTETLTGLHTPIIGYSSWADGRTLLAAGMDDYLAKPASPAALSAKVASWCITSVA